ncbi:MAG: NTP transferase domain-containing protein [Betaproteobacteria bacterium]
MPGSGISQTVILAAGLGSRLAGAEAGTPKPLHTVAGLPLVVHALAHARASGCDEAVIVIGHEGARVRQAVEALDGGLAVRFVENPDPTTPNGESLLVAEPYTRERFYLQMVDHLFAAPVLLQLPFSIPTPDARTVGSLLVDRAPGPELDLADATKVRLEGDRVTAIGKAVEPWDAIDAGCFALTRGVFDALRGVSPPEPRTVSSAMRQLAARRALAFADLGSVRWVDVDTPADRETAERLLLTAAGRGV